MAPLLGAATPLYNGLMILIVYSHIVVIKGLEVEVMHSPNTTSLMVLRRVGQQDYEDYSYACVHTLNYEELRYEFPVIPQSHKFHGVRILNDQPRALCMGGAKQRFRNDVDNHVDSDQARNKILSEMKKKYQKQGSKIVKFGEDDDDNSQTGPKFENDDGTTGQDVAQEDAGNEPKDVPAPTTADVKDKIVFINRTFDDLMDPDCSFTSTMRAARAAGVYAVAFSVYFGNDSVAKENEKRFKNSSHSKIDDSELKGEPLFLFRLGLLNKDMEYTKPWRILNRTKEDDIEGLMYQPPPPRGDTFPLMIMLGMATLSFMVGSYWGGKNMARDFGVIPPLIGEEDEDEEPAPSQPSQSQPSKGGAQELPNGSKRMEALAGTIDFDNLQAHHFIIFACFGVTFITFTMFMLFLFYDTLGWLLLFVFSIAFAISSGLVAFGTVAYYALPPDALRAKVNLCCDIKFNTYKIPCLFCGLIVATMWVIYRKEYSAWVLQSVLGICLCIFIISLVQLPNLVYCTALLSGLFCYDVFMVYISPHITGKGESIMVKVAMGNEQLGLFTLGMLKVAKYYPKYPWDGVCGWPHSVLGFGDIIIPGLIASYSFGCDIIFKTPYKAAYFLPQLVAYVVGLGLTFTILLLTKSAVPALVTLVPCHLTAAYTVYCLRPPERYPYLWGPTRANRRKGIELAAQNPQTVRPFIIGGGMPMLLNKA